jgi:uncharacterized OsmC-like protein
MDLRSVQQPLKDAYRADPAQARITLTARGTAADAPVACSVDLGRAIYEAQAHTGVGGAGFGAIRLRFAVDAPDATDEQLDSLLAKTERYCTVAQTLMFPPALDVELTR